MERSWKEKTSTHGSYGADGIDWKWLEWDEAESDDNGELLVEMCYKQGLLPICAQGSKEGDAWTF
eukprot:12892224-Prorocentrum_lima.AAC.1